MKLTDILTLLKRDVDDKPPDTYQGELNRQCKSLIVPTFVVFMVGWLPYIRLDEALYPGMYELIYLRLGVTVVGMVGLLLYLFPYFQKRSYFLLAMMLLYAELVTGLIVGLVAADPAYMGGFSLLIILLPIFPIRKIHALLIIVGTFVVFIIAGIGSNMRFETTAKVYGLYNLIVGLMLAVTALVILDNIRKRNYLNHISIHTAHEELQDASQTLVSKNEELEKTSQELAVANDELRSANKVKRELLGMAAHDLKDPLQVISLYTDTLKVELDENVPALKKLNRISRSTEKMINLIKDLLETATIDSGRLKLNKNPWIWEQWPVAWYEIIPILRIRKSKKSICRRKKVV